MARRRKKSKAAAAAKNRERDQSPMITEKSLPALPPNVIPNNAFSNDRVDPEPDTPTELSPRPHQGHMQTESSSRSNSRPAARSPERQAKPEGLGLSHASHRNSNRNSTMLSNEVAGDDGFFIPVALDPSPGPTANSRSGSGTVGDATKKKDYFSIPKSSFSERSSQASTPHIAFQEKGRQPSTDYSTSQAGTLSRNLSKQSAYEESSSAEEKAPKVSKPRPSQGSDDVKLQEASKRRPNNNISNASSPAVESPMGTTVLPGSASREQLPLSESRKNSENVMPRRSQDTRRSDVEGGRPSLETSRTAPNPPKAIPRKEVGSSAKSRKQAPAPQTTPPGHAANPFMIC